MSDLKDKLQGVKAREKPAPISMKKPRRKKKLLLPPEPVEAFNEDAPEHKSPLATLKDKRLDSTIATVKELKAAVAGLGARDIIVKVPPAAPRARIERIAIEYDGLGHPKALVPTYGE